MDKIPYPWHYFGVPAAPAAQPLPPPGFSLPPLSPAIRYQPPLGHWRAKDPESVKITFNSFLNAINPMKIDGAKPSRSSSASSDSTIDIPRSQPFPYYYRRPYRSPISPFSYHPLFQPYRAKSMKPTDSRPQVDGHETSEEPKPVRAKEKHRRSKTVIVLKHYCAQCGRPRSKRYQREHPVKPGIIPIPGICSRCIPPEPDSESEDVSEHDEDNEPVVSQHGRGMPLHTRSMRNGQQEVEEVLVCRGRGQSKAIANTQLPPAKARTTRHEQKYTHQSHVSESSDSSDLDCEPVINQRINRSGQSRVQPQPNKPGHTRVLEIVQSDDEVEERRTVSSRRRAPASTVATYRYKIADRSKSAKQPVEMEDHAHRTRNGSSKDNKGITRAGTAPPQLIEDPVKYQAAEETTATRTWQPDREFSPLRVKVIVQSRSRYQHDGPEDSPLQEDSEPGTDDQDQLAEASTPIVARSRPAYSVARPHKNKATSAATGDESQKVQRSISPPEWYFRQHRRYTVPKNLTTRDELSERQQSYMDRFPRREFPAYQDRLDNGQRRSQLHSPRLPDTDGHFNRRYDRSRARASRHNDEDSFSSDSEGPRSRVTFAPSSKRTDSNSAVPCTPRRERVLRQEREALYDYDEAEQDQRDFERRKKQVRRRVHEGAGALELDGHQSDDVGEDGLPPVRPRYSLNSSSDDKIVADRRLHVGQKYVLSSADNTPAEDGGAQGISRRPACRPALRRHLTHTQRETQFRAPSLLVDDPIRPGQFPVVPLIARTVPSIFGTPSDRSGSHKSHDSTAHDSTAESELALSPQSAPPAPPPAGSSPSPSRGRSPGIGIRNPQYSGRSGRDELGSPKRGLERWSSCLGEQIATRSKPAMPQAWLEPSVKRPSVRRFMSDSVAHTVTTMTSIDEEAVRRSHSPQPPPPRRRSDQSGSRVDKNATQSTALYGSPVMLELESVYIALPPSPKRLSQNETDSQEDNTSKRWHKRKGKDVESKHSHP